VSSAIDELETLLDEAGLTVKFGLVAQGHVPTVSRMLMDGRSWEDIGAAIGWCPDTVRQHVGMLLQDDGVADGRDA